MTIGANYGHHWGHFGVNSQLVDIHHTSTNMWGIEAVSRIFSTIKKLLHAWLVEGRGGEPILKACVTTFTNFLFSQQVKLKVEASDGKIYHEVLKVAYPTKLSRCIHYQGYGQWSTSCDHGHIDGKSTPWENLISSERSQDTSIPKDNMKDMVRLDETTNVQNSKQQHKRKGKGWRE